MVKEAVTSVLSQSYSNLECIVVDDGSTQKADLGSLQRDSRLHYVLDQHRGVSASRNRGIELATGEHVAFLDSDDLWHADKLALQIDAIREHPEAGLCYTDEVWLKNGEWLNQGKRHKKFSGWIFPFCLPLCIVSFSSALLPRRVIDELGPLNENLPVCEDYEYWIRLSLRYPVVFLARKLVTKRAGHGDQLSRRFWGMDRFRVQALLGIFVSEHLSSLQKELVARTIESKCRVLAGGARKRGFTHRADYFERISTWVQNQISL